MKSLTLTQKAYEAAEQLQENQVHIWHIPFDQTETSLKILSPDEIIRGNEYKFAIHRQQFMAYRAVLRQVLAGYYDLSPKNIVFKYTEYNKPYVKTDSSGFQFNLSHAEDMAVLGITKTNPLGIDIEYIKLIADTEDVARQFFSKIEYSKFVALPDEYKIECFYEIWTRKEAFIKAIGEGLSYPLDQFVVSFHRDNPTRIIYIDNSTTEANKWHLTSLDIQHQNKHYKLACVVKTPHSEFIEFFVKK